MLAIVDLTWLSLRTLQLADDQGALPIIMRAVMDNVPSLWKHHPGRDMPDTGPCMSIFILIKYDAGFAGTASIASPYSLQPPTFATATPSQIANLTCDCKAAQPEFAFSGRQLVPPRHHNAETLFADNATNDRLVVETEAAETYVDAAVLQRRANCNYQN